MLGAGGSKHGRIAVYGGNEVAETSGDVLMVSTPGGDAEAMRMGRAENGQSRWSLRFHWGAETLYGNAEQAVARMTMRVEEWKASTLRQI